MKLWRFLRTESKLNVSILAGTAAIAGFSNALLMVVINAAAEIGSRHETGFLTGHHVRGNLLFIAFVAALFGYILGQRFVLKACNTEMERMIGRVRLGLVAKIRQSELQSLEELGFPQISSLFTRDMQVLSQTASPAVIALQSALMVFFTAIYIAFLNLIAFGMTIGIIGIAVIFHLRQRTQMAEAINVSNAREAELLGLVAHLLEGFKEVKLSTSRSTALGSSLLAASNQLVGTKEHTWMLFAENFIFSQSVFYLLLGALVFVFPRIIGGTYYTVLTDFTAAILFIMGPLSNLVGTIPLFSAAEIAVTNILAIESKLNEVQAVGESLSDEPATVVPDFRELRLSGVRFEYKDREGKPVFTLGPINLSIRKGQIIFLIGGNGSGKSTLLKLISALYDPQAGRIELDGQSPEELGKSAYRNLFSAVFSDYHLFDRLYGIDASDDEVSALLTQMQLSEKTQVLRGQFSNLDLSTGQRKRVALVVSLLENRSIMILDEWAADQDPEFRAKFYTEILPSLKHSGRKTIIVATHDDRFFHIADVVFKLDAGVLTRVKIPKPLEPAKRRNPGKLGD